MKKLFYSLLAGVIMLASCQKDADLAMGGDDGMVDVAISVAMEGASATTRAIETYGTGDKIDRCIMEVYLDDGTFYKRMESYRDAFTVATDGTITVDFDLRLVASQTYDFLFWADASKGSTYNYADNHYDTNTDGLKSITTDYDSYVGSDETRDAFFGNLLDKDISASAVLSVTLTRPFGQLNVLTDLTDVPDNMCPKYVEISHKTNVATSFNVEDGSIGDEEAFVWSAVAEVIEASASVLNATSVHLSTDYIFAPANTEQKLIDFEMSFYTSENKSDLINTNSNFTSIPVQRNYRTNVSGELVTKQGTINVTINPIFETPDIEVDVTEVASFDHANSVIASASSDITITFNSETVLSSDPDENFIDVPSSIYDKGATTVTFDLSEVLTNESSNEVTIGDSTTDDNDDSSEYSGTVNIIVSDEDQIDKINVLMPNAHVVFYGTTGEVISSTSGATFVIAEGASVDNLTINGGNVDIYGTVTTSIVRGESNSDSETIVKLYTDTGSIDGATIGDGITIVYIDPSLPIQNLTSGAGYDTLTEAVTAASAGDTIYVSAGVYTTAITISKALTIQGPNAGVAGYSDARVEEANFTTKTITLAADDITLDGISFNGGSNSYPVAHSGDIENLTFKNLYVNNQPYIFLRNTDTTGDVTNLVVESCKFSGFEHNTFSFTFFLYNLVSATFTDNVFDDITRHGLNLQVSPNATSLVIKENTFTNCGECAIQLANQNAGKIDIYNNTINNCYTAFNIYAWKSVGKFAAQIDIYENLISDVHTVACVGNADYVDNAGVPELFAEGAYITFEDNTISLDYWQSMYYAYMLSDFYSYDGVVTFTNNDVSGGRSGVYDTWANILNTNYAFHTDGYECTKVNIDGVLYQPKTTGGYYLEEVTE